MAFSVQLRSSLRAFTLIELSIVLVIIGLLVGGLLAGRSIMRASELRSVATQQERFVTAIHAFQDKYSGLPGDLANAQTYWGVAHATPATCITTASTTTATCNGDGNGIVHWSTPGSNEIYRFWQHLANAGLIEFQYSGVTGGGVNAFTSIPSNSPAGKLRGSLWWVFTWGVITGDVRLFNNDYTNILEYGSKTTNYFPSTSVFTPEELWNIDMKIDDGKPAIGKLVAYAAGGLSTCTTTIGNNSATLTADYLRTLNEVNCAAIFLETY